MESPIKQMRVLLSIELFGWRFNVRIVKAILVIRRVGRLIATAQSTAHNTERVGASCASVLQQAAVVHEGSAMLSDQTRIGVGAPGGII